MFRLSTIVCAGLVLVGCAADENAPNPGAGHNADSAATDVGNDARRDAGSGLHDTGDSGGGGTDGAGADQGVAPDAEGGELGVDLADSGGDAWNDAGPDVGPDLPPPPDDPFDPASCSGTPWDGVDALARLGVNEAEILDAATVMTRSRTCDAGGCGAWGSASPTVVSFLTWSGGVTTRYTDLQIDTKLVLWSDAGVPKLSVRHDTHLAQYPDDHGQGIVFGFPAEVVPYPYIRAWNVVPENMYDYRDLENYLGRDAQLFASPSCALFLSVLPGGGADETTQYAALYRF